MLTFLKRIFTCSKCQRMKEKSRRRRMLKTRRKNVKGG